MMKKINSLFMGLTLLPFAAHASFIESTLGTAVVNDATASYFNPAALVLLKNPQAIGQETFANFRTQFSGQVRPPVAGIGEFGRSSASTSYYSPAFYFGLPTGKNIILGLAIVSNTGNRDADENSILRYVQASNNIQDYDIVPSMGVKINDYFAIGAGVNFSYANFLLKPISGVAALNIPDSQSQNQSDGRGIGGNIGVLLKPTAPTVIGFDYRSKTTYQLSGTSIFDGPPHVVSTDYHFKLLTPARSVLSINQFLTSTLGLIATVQRIQFSSTTKINVYGIANVIGTTPVILNASVPNYLRDTWLLTLGTHCRLTPKWILRVAGSYAQSPGNPRYQVTTGDTFIIGASTGYEINKIITIDGSYAHAFVQNENINTTGARYLVTGVNQAWRNSVSLKLTVNI